MNIFIDNKSGAPIYEQIFTQLKSQIISGTLPSDEALPSIRSLAKDLRISVVTTKRAYDELEKEGFSKDSIDTYLGMFKEITTDIEGVRYCKEKLSDVLDPKVAEDLETIITAVDSVKNADFKISFDPTLVRGMSYYKGPIFEIAMDEFGGSVGGGGRNDEMIGKFTGQDTPACGFSIGFERIVMLLLENGYEVPTVKEKKAYLLEKKMTKEGLLKVMSLAKADRQAGKQVLIVNMKKNKKFQKEQLTEDGYTEIVDCYADSVENL